MSGLPKTGRRIEDLPAELPGKEFAIRNSQSAIHAAIRQAGENDAPAILALEESSFADPHERFHVRQIRRLIRSPSAIVIVAQAKGRVVGWAAALTRRHAGGVTGRVYAIAVDPAARGMKIGRQLMARILSLLKRQGADRIYLEVRQDNQPALALYHKLGFKDIKLLADYYRPGLHALRMVLDQR